LPENIRGLFYFFPSLAARFDGTDIRKIGGDVVGCESLNVHFDQADERTTVIGPLAPAAIDDDADAGDFPAVRMDDIDRFLDAPPTGHHVFSHNEPFVRPNLKTAPQDEAPSFFFHEDVALPKGAAHFLADDDSAEGGGDHAVAVDLAQLIGQPSANVGGDVGVLEEERALEELPAMQARPQNEMAVEQSPGLSEEREQIVAH
jgi:hypothetical protein